MSSISVEQLRSYFSSPSFCQGPSLLCLARYWLIFHRYVWFQLHTHHGLYADSLEKDEERDADRHLDLAKDKLTFTECVVALVIALTCVSLHAVFLGKPSFHFAS